MSDKLNKFLVVVFLTLLIWTWAFMSKAKEHSFTGTLAVSPGTDPSLLVTFFLNDSSTPLTEVPLKSLNFVGAPSKLSDLQKRYILPPDDPDVERLNFYYDSSERPEGPYTLKILDHLQNNIKIQELALSLESCTPSEVTVNIEQLVEKELPVACVDKFGVTVDGAVSNPAFVKIYVKNGYNGPATVELSPQLIETAKKGPIPATPFVKLNVAGVKREAAGPVQITVQSEQRLKQFNLQPTTYGFIMGPKIASDYKVELTGETFTGTTSFIATEEAWEAYKKMRLSILIEIRPGDELLSEIPPRPVIYNFPPEYFKNGDIDAVEVAVPKTATFKLIPINPSPTP
ncbi:MAG: hypothetical protein OEV87_11655 [Phycisphaerae bacterium]|nr:hypothetical protein [Phycisphaerae bacterium]